MNESLDLFLPYQKRWVKDSSKTSIYKKSRRIGITWSESYRAVIECLTSTHDYNFVSANLKTSIEFVSYCKTWAKVVNEAAEEDVIDLSDTTTTELRFPQGNKVIALSANPGALRGRSGTVVLDEIAFHENPEEMYMAAQPVCLWGGYLRLISSVSTPDSWFCRQIERVEQRELPWSLHSTTIIDAVNEGLAAKIPGEHQKLLPDIEKCNSLFLQNLKAEVGSDAAWSQEYLCEPASHSSIITNEQYDKIALEPISKDLDANKMYGELYIGVDIGRVKDLSVIWVLEKGIDKEAPVHLRDVYRTVAIQSVRGMTFESQFQIISKYLSHEAAVKCCIDRSGLGLQLAEQLTSEFGSLVEGVAISAPAKQDLVERTIKFVSQERVSLPKDEKIKSDIVCMRRIVNQKGNISYDGRSTIGHGDHFIALAMALRAASKTANINLLTS